MALSIGVKQGSKISVGEHELEVKSILPSNVIVVSIDSGDDIVISEQPRTQLLPDVFVFSGVGATGHARRLAFEAPRSVAITRHPD